GQTCMTEDSAVVLDHNVVAVGAQQLLLVHPAGPHPRTEQFRFEGDHRVQVPGVHRAQLCGHEARFLPPGAAMSGSRRYSASTGCGRPAEARRRARWPRVSACTTWPAAVSTCAAVSPGARIPG